MKTVKSNLKRPAQAFTPFAQKALNAKALKAAQKESAVEFPHHPSMYDPVEAPEQESNWSPPKSWGWE